MKRSKTFTVETELASHVTLYIPTEDKQDRVDLDTLPPIEVSSISVKCGALMLKIRTSDDGQSLSIDATRHNKGTNKAITVSVRSVDVGHSKSSVQVDFV